ncbi:structural maintenance of chromosomes protein 4-like isoform X2 [Chenopodium quinoa]|uniref:structural maintenance of chromosomes protein 4-like isoform X2 n=1 Tax=Chenopodium quinoa TaxID=63459 RepID=UPI000B771DE2|nr:structural maintenance of chromosomes protein 4-like isoform X2 [Chenopodium quinoa]
MGKEMDPGADSATTAYESTQSGSRTPRLFIKEMVMRNFKSYAGEQRVGPFHKSFSAVVGPNGSGKSNVIDAMLFVFGKRAKQMRLNKVSELIHNSTNHQNLDSAGVSVHFQEIIDLDDGEYEVVEGSEFVITRVAFRDNSSKYYINDRTSNFTEVTTKLKAKGVDLDNNRFLILQGEVEQISLMKPKAQGPHDEGFLEYFEDIIGTNKYVEKIDESSKQLEALNEKRSGVVQMVKLAEKERDSLEDVKNEAESFMLKELSLFKWQERATKLAAEDNNAKMAELQNNLSSLEESLKLKREEIQGNKSTLKELETLHNKYLKRQEELDNDLRSCKEEFKEFERQDVQYREDYKHMKQKIKKLEDKIEKDSSKINDFTKDCENATQAIPKLEEDIPKLQKRLVEEEKVLEDIKEKSKGETEIHRSELAKVRAELEPWENQLMDHKGKLEVASTERKLLNDKHEGAQKAFEDAQKRLEDISDQINSKSAAITSIKNDLEKKESEASNARKAEQECVKEQESLIPLEQAARQKVAELVSVMESERSQGSVLKEILRAKETNQIKGIHGRMGDLGAIDAKYDVAVSTACPGLDYILVETAEAAQKCVDLLREKNLGVATFMILASRIAYGQSRDFRRVVTLEGALFEKSGTMSGGGNKPRGGKMGTSIRADTVSKEAVTDAEKELSMLVDKLNAIRRRIADSIQSYQSLDKAIQHLEMKLAKSQKEIDSLNTQNDYLKNQLESLKSAAQPKKEEVSRLAVLQNTINAEEKEIAKLTQGSKKLKEKASELQNKVENAGGEILKNQKAKVDKLQSDIDKHGTEINRHKVQIETGEKMIKKLTKGIGDSKKEQEFLHQEREKMHSTFKAIEQKAFAVQENYKKTEKLFGEHREVLDKAKSDYESLKRKMDELRATEVDADFKLKDMKKLHKEMEVKERGYNKKLDDLQNAIMKHMEQIAKDSVDQEKLKSTLEDETLSMPCNLKKALEMVALLEAQLKEMNPNLDSISEYRKKVASYNERVDELNEVTQERDDIKKQYDEWRKKRLDEFMAGFNTISLKLKEMYQMITLGGDAELELVDSLDPFSEGVVFSVRPPKKSWKNIANLSGGEKTLSSLALIFALHHYKPTPLYVMDEIDAALDFKNVSIVGHYVKDRTKNAQFVIISLRNNMFELADRLVGIYKTDNCTKSITINPGSFAVCQKAA